MIGGHVISLGSLVIFGFCRLSRPVCLLRGYRVSLGLPQHSVYFVTFPQCGKVSEIAQARCGQVNIWYRPSFSSTVAVAEVGVSHFPQPSPSRVNTITPLSQMARRCLSCLLLRVTAPPSPPSRHVCRSAAPRAPHRHSLRRGGHEWTHCPPAGRTARKTSQPRRGAAFIGAGVGARLGLRSVGRVGGGRD